MQETIIQALTKRHSPQSFDTTKKVESSVLTAILESGRLAPSAFGIEPWKFLVVTDTETRVKLREVSFGQSKVTDASHLIIVARRTDMREQGVSELLARIMKTQEKSVDELSGLKGMVEGFISSQSDIALDTWVKAQTYIPLGMMIETAALLGVDVGPMEGFVPDQVDEILGLKNKHMTATTMLALGYTEEGVVTRPKVRRPFSEVVEFIA